MEKNLSNKIYNVNFVLIIMIVILHSSMYNYTTGSLRILFKIIDTICDMATPMFFLISAYLFYRNFNIKKYFYKLKTRIRSLLIPYLLWGIILYLYYFTIIKIPGINTFFNNQFDFSLKVLPYNIVMASCAMTMWFVRCLIIYTLCSPIIYNLLKTKIIGIITIVLLFLINVIFNFEYSNPLFWISTYMLGALVAIHYKSIIENNKKIVFKPFKIMTIIILSLLILFVSGYDQYSKTYYIYRTISPLFLFIIMFYGYKNRTVNRFKYGCYSFWIFCIHLPIIQVIKKSLMYLVGNSNITICLCYILTIMLSILLCIILGMITKKLFSKTYSLLSGNR